MLLYARAFDEWNQNTAFTMLRSAVERLASPGRGDYDDVVRRRAFLWEEPEAMGTSARAPARISKRVHAHRCRDGNSKFFKSLGEANQFVDLPTSLAHRKKMRAHRFELPFPSDDGSARALAQLPIS